ncbi:uncharacterized protein LOC130635869 [Hydractinia symbiolongicarpus]|uniref:uncharacterized protein LOC130635869 n=1 Tax=Hydractinia symbiolongicarpus TaxID=13093 RepID=UPI00254D2542|nr:uncharacterized protein LOC130635869 [Hydractinia symbiolongicarpus]
MELFEQACIKFLENDIELYSVSEFHNMMSTLGDDVYTIKMTQVKLKERYKETLQLVTREGKSNIILLHRAAEFLSEKWYAERKKDIKDESERIVRTAALLIKEAIKNYDLDSANYPSSKDIKTSSNVIPSILTIFLHGLFSSSIKEKTLAQAIVAATRPRSIMPIQFGLAVCTDNKIGSKWLNILLSKLGLAVSYDEVVRFKQNVIKHDTSNEVVCPEGTTFLQFVSDNTDHDLATLDGKQTHHGLGSLAVANGNFGAQRLPTRRIPREKKENWSNIQGNKGIEIHEYLEPEVPALAKTVMKPITIEVKILKDF